ncbi:MAG: tetratricopeptide repeat protein [Gammaproteobacteria bacterium]|jgi:tetratricopeptide (TPR) repeat protein
MVRNALWRWRFFGLFSAMLLPLQLQAEVFINWQGLEDPYVRDALFDSYQGQHFSAITRLLSAQKSARIKGNPERASLVLGGLYLAYGFHQEAADLFEAFLATNQPQEVRDEAWFYLAKTQYQRGQYQQARAALNKIQGDLGINLQPERYLIEAVIDMKQDRLDQAIETLNKVDQRTNWGAYGRYNLAIALFRLGRSTEAETVLNGVGTMNANDQEMQNLKDKANLMLGNASLEAGATEKAKSYFKRLKLNGMNSNQGLLGLGRAYSALNEHKKSLVPWLKLVERNPSDPAVQDALMAVPYAFGQLEAYKQSLDYYEKAMRLFQEEINKINTAAEAVSGGKLVEGLIRAQTGESVSGLWTEAKVLNTPEGQYLWPLLTQYEFRETMFNYSQLRLSLGKLEGWSASLDTFDSLNDKRRAVYESRITQLQTQVLLASEKLNHHLQRMAFDELDKRKQRLVQYFNEARFSVAQIYDYAAKRWGEPQQ